MGHLWIPMKNKYTHTKSKIYKYNYSDFLNPVTEVLPFQT